MRLIARLRYWWWLRRFMKERDHCTGFGEKPMTWWERLGFR